MKNKTVEAMLRTQFNIPEDVGVFVNCVASEEKDGTTFYEFECEWFDYDNTFYSVNARLPHLEVAEIKYPKEKL